MVIKGESDKVCYLNGYPSFFGRERHQIDDEDPVVKGLEDVG